MLWGRIVSVLSQSGVTDTKDETEQETSSPPLTQVCQQEIIYITNTTNSNEKIILFLFYLQLPWRLFLDLHLVSLLDAN